MDPAETRYARSGDVRIACQVFGDGPFDLVFASVFSRTSICGGRTQYGLATLLVWRGFHVSSCSTSGAPASRTVAGAPDLETQMDDVRGVMFAAGSERAALLGNPEAAQ